MSTPDEAGRILAERAGLGAMARLTPLPGGRNNRVFALEAGAGRFLLKVYFTGPADPRDRLGAEWGFLRLAWDAGVRRIPEPLAMDRDLGAALYAFLPGRVMARDEVGPGHAAQAAEFLAQLAFLRGLPESALPAASESCFSLDAHLARVAGRVARLESLEPGLARDFARNALAPAWARAQEAARGTAARRGLDPARELPQAERLASPSDFGFHNALLGPDGVLRFVDFEYAGWDDPAKLVCDFFSGPDLPPPASALPEVAAAVSRASGCTEAAGRVEALLPAYRVKWCCIMLNDFLPCGAGRRDFACRGGDAADRRAGQLAKARAYLAEYLQ